MVLSILYCFLLFLFFGLTSWAGFLFGIYSKGLKKVFLISIFVLSLIGCVSMFGLMIYKIVKTGINIVTETITDKKQ